MPQVPAGKPTNLETVSYPKPGFPTAGTASIPPRLSPFTVRPMSRVGFACNRTSCLGEDCTRNYYSRLGWGNCRCVRGSGVQCAWFWGPKPYPLHPTITKFGLWHFREYGRGQSRGGSRGREGWLNH